MLRFIVYRYISYKDSKISHASLLTLRHHLSQLPPALPPPHCPTTCTCPTPPPQLYSPPHSPTTLLTVPPPAPALLHPALLPSSLPHHQHTTYPTTRLSILDPPTLPMCTLLPYPLLRSHLLHILSRTPHTRATLPTALPISPTDVPCPSISYRLYHTALPRTPLSSI